MNYKKKTKKPKLEQNSTQTLTNFKNSIGDTI